jgi:hypothetical protein
MFKTSFVLSDTKRENICFSVRNQLINESTPRRTVLLEKLPGHQVNKKFHIFHETRRFITVLNPDPVESNPFPRVLFVSDPF